MFNGLLAYAAFNTQTSSEEVFASNGRSSQVLVRADGISGAYGLSASNDRLVFAGIRNWTLGAQLFGTDCTANGTTALTTSGPYRVRPFAGYVCYFADQLGRATLQCTDGTLDGTTQLADIMPHEASDSIAVSPMTVYRGGLYFVTVNATEAPRLYAVQVKLPALPWPRSLRPNSP